jgi:GNAT superfamily N-acetyltransferase
MKNGYHNANQLDWQASIIIDEIRTGLLMSIPVGKATCGPDGDPAKVRNQDDAGPSFRELLEGLAARVGVATRIEGALPQHVGSEIRTWISTTLTPCDPILQSDEGFHRIVKIDPDAAGAYGLAALSETASDDFRISGLLIGSDLAVDKFSRGLGFGRGLIAAHLLDTGDLPTWRSETVELGQGGAETIARGLELARRLALAAQPEEMPEP